MVISATTSERNCGSLGAFLPEHAASFYGIKETPVPQSAGVSFMALRASR